MARAAVVDTMPLVEAALEFVENTAGDSHYTCHGLPKYSPRCMAMHAVAEIMLAKTIPNESSSP